MGNMIITVSRQYGSGGKTIAAMLAQKLGINCYSREILKIASEDSGINERLFGMSDEKLRHAVWLKTLSHTYTGELLPPEDKGFTSDDNLFNYQAKTIKELAEKESCIIVGRCANYILKDNRIIGTIGGGCAEAEVISHCRRLLRKQEFKCGLMDVSMNTDDAEKEGMVCGGSISVLLEQIG